MKRNVLRLYFIMGTENVQNEPLHVLEEALKGGVTIFQFREKGLNALQEEAYIEFARACQALCKQYNVPFIVNDDIELAVKLDADGLHIGQDDGAVETARQAMKGKILGVSVHSFDEAQQAIQAGADYVGIGPVFATQSKADAESPCGTDFLQQVVARYPALPIVGIGGITADNAKQVLATGIDGIAVISAISLADNPLEAAQYLANL